MPPLAELVELVPQLDKAIAELPCLERMGAAGIAILHNSRLACFLGRNAADLLPKLELAVGLEQKGAATRYVAAAANFEEGLVDIPSVHLSFDNQLAVGTTRAHPDSLIGRLFFSTPSAQVHISEASTAGSGIIVGNEKFIGTASHVVEDPYLQYDVHINGFGSAKASVVARDPKADVALLKLKNAYGIPEPASLVSLADASIGDRVFQVARPNQYSTFLTKGQIQKFFSEPQAGAQSSLDLFAKLSGGGVPRQSAAGDIARVIYDNPSGPGFSGSGMISRDGRVVAVHTHTYYSPNNKLFVGTAADHLQTLLENLRSQGSFEGFLTQESKAIFSDVDRFDGVTTKSLNLSLGR